jgi:hypothetical protein
MKNASLKMLIDKYSWQVSKLPVEVQAIFLEDLETAIVSRLKVLKSAS